MNPTPEEQEEAFKKLFGNYTCGQPPVPPSWSGGMGDGRKSTRIRSHNSSRRRRRHAQRGGAKLGPYAEEWAKYGEFMITENESVERDKRGVQTTATLRFYRTIVFVDIVHLLGLDSYPVDVAKCTKLADIICKHLQHEDILTAYIGAKMGSKWQVALGMTGVSSVGYAISQEESVYTYFAQLLAYISTTTFSGKVYEFAVRILNFYGVGTSFTGIIFSGLFLHGMYTMIYNFVTKRYPGPDFIERNIGRAAPVYKYILRPVFLGSLIQGYNIGSGIPPLYARILNAAKRYINPGGGGEAMRDVCDTISPTLDKLIGSTQVDPDLLVGLVEQFGQIIHEFSPEDDERLKCRFMNQFASSDDGLKLLVDFKVPEDYRPELQKEIAAAAAACPVGSSRPAAAAAAVQPPSPVQVSPAQYQPPPLPFSPLPVGVVSSVSVGVGNPPDRWMHPARLRRMRQSRMGQQSAQPGGFGSQGPPGGFGSQPGGLGAAVVNPASERSKLLRTTYGIGKLKKQTQWDGVDPNKKRKGGSSKHKKKHPRTTNKRKLLVKRVRRRSMKNKNKKKGKW